MITPQALADILTAHPTLSILGYPGYRTEPRGMSNVEREKSLHIDRLELLSALDQVRHAATWLAAQPRTAGKPSTKSPTSYWLKHAMEQLTGVYVTNGAFIAAALLLDVSMHLSPRGGLNPHLGIATRELKKAERAGWRRP